MTFEETFGLYFNNEIEKERLLMADINKHIFKPGQVIELVKRIVEGVSIYPFEWAGNTLITGESDTYFEYSILIYKKFWKEYVEPKVYMDLYSKSLQEYLQDKDSYFHQIDIDDSDESSMYCEITICVNNSIDTKEIIKEISKFERLFCRAFKNLNKKIKKCDEEIKISQEEINKAKENIEQRNLDKKSAMHNFSI